MALKKAKAKKAKKTAKKKKTASAAKTIRIKYRCEAGKCKARPKIVHLIKKGNYAALEAVNTDADIKFIGASPFTKSHFVIPMGTTQKAKVVKTAGVFPYVLSCSECGGLRPAGPPQMIVP